MLWELNHPNSDDLVFKPNQFIKFNPTENTSEEEKKEVPLPPSHENTTVNMDGTYTTQYETKHSVSNVSCSSIQYGQYIYMFKGCLPIHGTP